MGKTWGDSGKRTIVVTKPQEPNLEADTADIDRLLYKGLMSISRMMNSINTQAKDGTFDRQTVQNLKDIMQMLNDLKKKESDVLDTLTDEELKELSNEHPTD